MSKQKATRRGRIETRHRKAYRAHGGGRCNCQPSYRAASPGSRTGKRYRSDATYNPIAAERWLADALRALDAGVALAAARGPVADHIDDLLTRMRDGRALDRSGGRCTSRRSAPTRLPPRSTSSRGSATREIGAVRRRDVQELIDTLRLLKVRSVHRPQQARRARGLPSRAEARGGERRPLHEPRPTRRALKAETGSGPRARREAARRAARLRAGAGRRCSTAVST